MNLKFSRAQKATIAAVASILWFGYMAIGLAVINGLFPTVEGRGPEGTVAFIGLIAGFFVTGLVMWAASD